MRPRMVTRGVREPDLHSTPHCWYAKPTAKYVQLTAF